MEKETRIPMKFNPGLQKFEPDLDSLKKDLYEKKKKELIQKIIAKREFSQLPKRDVEMAFSHFEKRQTSDEEKIRLTRELLHKVFGAFVSQKLFSPKNKSEEWILRKHLSTRERIGFYKEIYKRILKGLGENIKIIDLGAGVNGFSYKYFQELGFDISYLAIEAIAQFVELMNSYFKKNKIDGKALHLSVFELEKMKKILKSFKKEKIIFLFKTLDSLEMLEENYSKKLLLGLASFVDKIVISFATESMIKRRKFRAKRKWILEFIKENFNVLDDFEAGSERFVVFCKKQSKN